MPTVLRLTIQVLMDGVAQLPVPTFVIALTNRRSCPLLCPLRRPREPPRPSLAQLLVLIDRVGGAAAGR